MVTSFFLNTLQKTRILLNGDGENYYFNLGFFGGWDMINRRRETDARGVGMVPYDRC